jgi:hypothetical protein
MSQKIKYKKRQIEFIDSENVYSNDIKYYYKSLKEIVKKSCLNIVTLGKVSNEKIYLINKTKSNNGVLITAGFHGEEPAGCWSILKYLKEEKNIGNTSFIPIVNPTGFKVGERLNMYGENPNRGFVTSGKLSKEGKILVKHIDLLTKISKEGILTLHEDCDANDCFVYCHNNKKVARKLQNVLLKYFKQLKDGPIYPECPDVISSNGIIIDCHDTSFEDYFSDKVSQCIATETPGNKKIQDRIDAGVEVIKTFIKETSK